MKDIDYKVLSKNDKILVYMNKDSMPEECLEIQKSLQKSFPENKVLIIHNKFIDKIEILKELESYNTIIDNYLAEISVL